MQSLACKMRHNPKLEELMGSHGWGVCRWNDSQFGSQGKKKLNRLAPTSPCLQGVFGHNCLLFVSSRLWNFVENGGVGLSDFCTCVDQGNRILV